MVMLDQDLERLMAERARLGNDKLDEMWEGTLHLVNAPKRVHTRMVARLLRQLHPYAEAKGLSVETEVAIFGEDPGSSWRIPDLVVFDEAESDEAGIVGGAALAIEMLSPGDDSFAKLNFYAARGVAQVLIIDPVTEVVQYDSVRQVGEAVRIPSLGVTLRRVDGRLEVRADD